MAAHADDLRYHYSEHLGQSQVVACSVAAARSEELAPGRYIVRVRTVAGASTIWLRFDDDNNAAASVPSTPIEISGTTTTAADVRALNAPLCALIVKGGGGPKSLSAILNAGTCQLVLTKISRDKA